ncbi:YolD-like family protein [Sporosarcina sp. D27]|uniref:YolD-like family protein n=1 Tax=Sporosarcina sp. D27 TaxID=1382305 RepID=UPI00046F4E31|nr:YolD-like family protein [Sporosarcina sp. D27]
MYDQNRDRGKIKWTAMMLPEHISLLREWQKEDDYVKQPDLTDFDLQDIQEQLESAMMRKCMTQIRSWKEGKVTGYLGTVEEIDVHKQLIVLQDPFEIERILATDIIAVQHVD